MRTDIFARFVPSLALLVIAASHFPLSLGDSARADVFELKEGGEIDGVLVETRDDGVHVVRTADGATVAVHRRDIARLVEDDPRLAVYHDRAKRTPDTAMAHGELAQWCDDMKMIEQRDHHYRRVLQIDPEDETARMELGYQRVGSQWLTRDELLESRGMQLYQGKYRTPQAISLLQRNESNEENNSDWFRQLRTWRDWMNNRRRPDRVEEGLALIAAVDDPDAAPALARLLDREDVPWIHQQLLATLGRLNHPATVKKLVDLSLYFEDAEVAREALEYLMGLEIPRSIVPFVSALRSKDNVIVNRAGEALGKLGDTEAISPLIDALETTHRFHVGGGPEYQADFGNSGGGGFSFGGGPEIVQKTLQNVQVLNALSKLSGQQDFGYDERAWRNWYVNQQSKNRIDSRRDE